MNRREILFRGKAVIGSEWIYGGYTYDDADKDHMITQVNEDGLVIGYVVDPETISQWTGLKDRDGKRIFEGDIMEIPDYRRGMWIAGKQPTKIKECKWSDKFHGADFKGVKVLGNVWDTPELIGKEVDNVV